MLSSLKACLLHSVGFKKFAYALGQWDIFRMKKKLTFYMEKLKKGAGHKKNQARALHVHSLPIR
jgi:hypothetical protein